MSMNFKEAIAAGKAWAEREAGLLEEREPMGPWVCTDNEAMPLVDGDHETRRRLAVIVNAAAASHWNEMAAAAVDWSEFD